MPRGLAGEDRFAHADGRDEGPGAEFAAALGFVTALNDVAADVAAAGLVSGRFPIQGDISSLVGTCYCLVVVSCRARADCHMRAAGLSEVASLRRRS